VSGSLYITHDGLYMSEQSDSLCLAGIIMDCHTSWQWLKMSLAESSDAASKYRSKFLGAVATLLILQAASEGLAPLPHSTELFCDNKCIISHGNSPLTALLEKQRQADLIRLIKYLAGTNDCRTTWEWVEGHTVKSKGWGNCMLPERLNNHADKLAKNALLLAIGEGATFERDFLYESVLLKLLGTRVKGLVRHALEANWGYHAAQEIYDSRNIIRKEDFHIVWCDSLGSVMSSYPKMFWVWLTKHVSDFCGTNVQLYYCSKGEKSSKCKLCGTKDEHTIHICRCRDPGRKKMFQLSVGEVRTWLGDSLREGTVAATVELYLLARGEVMMASCVHRTDPDLILVATLSNHLGWDSFIESQLSVHWLLVAAPLLRWHRQYLLPPAWGRLFIIKLHIIVHKQWVYRNSFIHFKG
jgi:hypothetical protein